MAVFSVSLPVPGRLEYLQDLHWVGFSTRVWSRTVVPGNVPAAATVPVTAPPRANADRVSAIRFCFRFSFSHRTSSVRTVMMHSEMEFVRKFLRANFGERAVSQGEEVLLRLFEEQKRRGDGAFRAAIQSACGDMRANMTAAQRLQLLDFLVMIAKADGVMAPQEVDALRFVTTALGLSMADLDSMLDLGGGVTDLDAAYKVLGVSPQATDAEVKAAYRQLALKHHPDRVATLGEDVHKAAERKFQEINEAKETIYRHRGMN